MKVQREKTSHALLNKESNIVKRRTRQGNSEKYWQIVSTAGTFISYSRVEDGDEGVESYNLMKNSRLQVSSPLSERRFLEAPPQRTYSLT